MASAEFYYQINLAKDGIFLFFPPLKSPTGGHMGAIARPLSPCEPRSPGNTVIH